MDWSLGPLVNGFLAACLFLSCAPTTARAPQAPAAAGAREPAALTALVGGTVFTATGAAPMPDAVVLLERDRIRAVGPRSTTPVPAGASVIDVTGRWVVPGLIDAHVHFFQSGGLYTRPDIVDLTRVRPYTDEYAATRASLQDTFKRYLACGVTGVVDMGGPFWNFEVREQAARTLLAPRTAVAGPLLSTVARPQFDPADLPILRADSAGHARELVRAQLRRKPDLIKLWGVLTPDRPPQDLTAITQAAIEEAHAAGVRVAVHATELETARLVVSLGADILVHGVTDQEVDEAFVALVKERGVVTIPTLVVYDGYGEVLGGERALSELESKYGSPWAIASWSELKHVRDAGAAAAGQKRKERMASIVPIVAANTLKLHRAGAAIAAGTDAGNIGTLPGPSLHAELKAMVRAGMSAEAVLIAATREAARVMQREPQAGTLQPGRLADLLVVELNPVAELSNLQRLTYVVKGGVVLRPGEILAPNPTWVVDRQLEAYNARDTEAFLGWYSDDVEIFELPEGKVKMRGKSELRAVYGKLFASSPSLHCTLLGRTVLGNVIVDHELITGRQGRGYFHGAAMYEVDQGLIRKVWFLPRPAEPGAPKP